LLRLSYVERGVHIKQGPVEFEVTDLPQAGTACGEPVDGAGFIE
jgi:hypothetical protein